MVHCGSVVDRPTLRLTRADQTGAIDVEFTKTQIRRFGRRRVEPLVGPSLSGHTSAKAILNEVANIAVVIDGVVIELASPRHLRHVDVLGGTTN